MERTTTVPLSSLSRLSRIQVNAGSHRPSNFIKVCFVEVIVIIAKSVDCEPFGGQLLDVFFPITRGQRSVPKTEPDHR
jgi:hypothetical protein